VHEGQGAGARTAVGPRPRGGQADATADSQRSLTMALAPETVAAQLADPATCEATLDALESVLCTRGSGASGGDMPLRLAAVAALTDCMAPCTDANMFKRMGVVTLAVITEAEDVTAAYGAAAGGGRVEALMSAKKNAMAKALRTSARELTTDHARIYGAARGWHHTGVFMPDCDTAMRAAGLDFGKFMQIVATDPTKAMDDDTFPKRMAELILELLANPEQLQPFVSPGLWNALQYCLLYGPSVGRHAVEMGLTNCMVRGLRAAGGPADWMVTLTNSPPLARPQQATDRLTISAARADRASRVAASPAGMLQPS
jgi:hypothetical protein